jgi:hypothetical protein
VGDVDARRRDDESAANGAAGEGRRKHQARMQARARGLSLAPGSGTWHLERRVPSLSLASTLWLMDFALFSLFAWAVMVAGAVSTGVNAQDSGFHISGSGSGNDA